MSFGLNSGGKDIHCAVNAKLRDNLLGSVTAQAVIMVVVCYGLFDGLFAGSMGVVGGKIFL